jgi:hypothetical protein
MGAEHGIRPSHAGLGSRRTQAGRSALPILTRFQAESESSVQPATARTLTHPARSTDPSREFRAVVQQPGERDAAFGPILLAELRPWRLKQHHAPKPGPPPILTRFQAD